MNILGSIAIINCNSKNFDFLLKTTCPTCRRRIRSINDAFIDFNAEDAEHYIVENYARNADRNNQQNAQNRGWIEEDNVNDENEGQDEDEDDSMSDESEDDTSESVEFPIWNFRITVSADDIRIERIHN